MFLAKRIRESRKKQKLTQQELGTLLNVSKVSVCLWEKGTKVPSSKNLIQLSKVLNVSMEYLLGNDSYVVSENDEKYGLVMAKEEIEIIRELRNHKKLYEELIESPKRTMDAIEHNNKWMSN